MPNRSSNPPEQPDDPADFLAHLSSSVTIDLVPLAVAARLGLTVGIMPMMVKTGADSWRIAGQTFTLAQIRTAATGA